MDAVDCKKDARVLSSAAGSSDPLARCAVQKLKCIYRGMPCPVVTVCLSFEDVRALTLLAAGSCCSCVTGQMYMYGLSQGAVVCCLGCSVINVGWLKVLHWGRPRDFDKL